MSNQHLIDSGREEALDALPAVLSVIRWLVMSSVEPGDPDGYELKVLLDACVVGAHRLRLREQLRAR